MHSTDADVDLLADYLLELLKAGEWVPDIREHILRDIDELLDPSCKTHPLRPAPKKSKMGRLTAPVARGLVVELLLRFAPQNRLQKIPVHNPDEVVTKNTDRQELEELARKGLIPSGPRHLRRQNAYRPTGVPAQYHQLPPRPAFDATPASATRTQSRKRKQDDRDGSTRPPMNDYQYGRTASGSKRRVQGDRAANSFSGGPQMQSQHQSRSFGASNPMQNGFGSGFDPSNGPHPNFPGLGQIPYPPPALTNFGQMATPQVFPGMVQPTTPAFNMFGQMLPMPPDPNAPLDRQTAMNMLQAFEGLQNMVSTMSNAFQRSSNEKTNEQKPNSAQLCPDFATNGFCSAGPSCPYTHGKEITVPPALGTYDPTAPVVRQEPQSSSLAASFRQASNSGGWGQRGKYPVWASKIPGGYNSTLVVMRIPDQNCNEADIRAALGQFGNILEVLVHANDRLALVRFDNMDSVHSVFRSTTPLFNSKLILLSWYRPDLIPAEQSYDAAVNGKHILMSKPWDNLTYDPEEFAKKNAEDLKRHEQLQLEKKLVQNMEERLKVRAELRSKGEELPEDPELVEYMKGKAARLEAQMNEIDQENGTEYHGAFYFPRSQPVIIRDRQFCSVNRLDNRPKSLSLSFDDKLTVKTTEIEDLNGLTPEQIEERMFEILLVRMRFGGPIYRALPNLKTGADPKQVHEATQRQLHEDIEHERARREAEILRSQDEQDFAPPIQDLLSGAPEIDEHA